MIDTKYYNRYSYQELRAALDAQNVKQIDIDTLGEWFDRYGDRFWNGECYDADGIEIIPVYEWDDELDQGEIIRYEIR